MSEPSSLDPQLVVFDLDECLWSPETYLLDHPPTKRHCVIKDLNGKGKGVREVICSGRRCSNGGDRLVLHPGALHALQEFHAGSYPHTKLALASSAVDANAVRIAHAALRLLEVVPGTTVYEVVMSRWPADMTGHIQIGREGLLSANKAATHFPLIQKATQIPYSGMLFFDDCNWGDNCGEVERGCPGVVGYATPHGLRVEDWEAGLAKYRASQK